MLRLANLRASVEVEGRLVVRSSWIDAPNDEEPIAQAIDTIDPAVGTVDEALADNGLSCLLDLARAQSLLLTDVRPDTRAYT